MSVKVVNGAGVSNAKLQQAKAVAANFGGDLGALRSVLEAVLGHNVRLLRRRRNKVIIIIIIIIIVKKRKRNNA